MSSGKWRLFCPVGDELMLIQTRVNKYIPQIIEIKLYFRFKGLKSYISGHIN